MNYSYPGLDWVIEQRIKEYKEDIEAVLDAVDEQADDKERVKQDQVIIQELTKILTGVGLERLSYVG
jgi:hypothetical protein